MNLDYIVNMASTTKKPKGKFVILDWKPEREVLIWTEYSMGLSSEFSMGQSSECMDASCENSICPLSENSMDSLEFIRTEG